MQVPAKTALTCQGMVIKPLRVSWDVLREEVLSDSFGPWKWGIGPAWIRPVPARPIDVHSDWDLGNLKAWLTLWTLCCVPQAVPEQVLWCALSRWGATAYGVVSLPWGGFLDPQWCFDGWYVSSGIHMNTRSQGCPTEHFIATGLLLLSTWF